MNTFVDHMEGLGAWRCLTIVIYDDGSLALAGGYGG